MARRKLKVNMLEDGDCRFLSLVPTGANRAPFRKFAAEGRPLEPLGPGVPRDFAEVFRQDEPTKTVDGVPGFPAEAFAVVPDPEKVSTWKLPLFDRPEDVPDEPSVRRTAAAAQALEPEGFRGRQVEIPEGVSRAAVKRRVLRAWLAARPDATRRDAPDVLKSEGGLDMIDMGKVFVREERRKQAPPASAATAPSGTRPADESIEQDPVSEGKGTRQRTAASVADVLRSETLAVAVANEVDLEAAKAAIQEAGLSVDDAREVEGATLFVQGAAEGADLAEDGQTYKLNDEIAVIFRAEERIKQFVPEGGTTSFTENLRAKSFFPSFMSAQDALGETIVLALRESESPEDAAEIIEKAVDEFGDTVLSMTRGLPADAFKLEAVVRGKSFAKERDPGVAAGEAESEGDAKGSEAQKQEAPEPRSGESRTDFIGRCREAGASFGDCSEKFEQAQKSEATNEPPAWAAKLQESVDGLGERLGAVEKQAKDAVDRSKTVEKAMKGRVTGEPEADPEPSDEEENERTARGNRLRRRKSAGEPPLLDTATRRFAENRIA